MARRLSIGVAWACLSLCACPFFGGGSGGGDPCSDDALDCGEGNVLTIDESCTLEDDLLLELGNGDGAFGRLAPGQDPDRVQGFQGGSHFVFGVAVDNPSPDHLAYEVTIDVELDDGGEFINVGTRTVVYDGELVEFDGQRSELLNITVVPDAWDSMGRITVTARDSCGRDGTLVHDVE